MIIVDTAIEQRLSTGKPIRVAMFGAGYSAKHICSQILSSFPVIHLVVIVNRTPENAESIYGVAGVDRTRRVSTVAQLQETIEGRGYAVTDDPSVVFECDQIDAVIETTGEVEFGAW